MYATLHVLHSTKTIRTEKSHTGLTGNVFDYLVATPLYVPASVFQIFQRVPALPVTRVWPTSRPTFFRRAHVLYDVHLRGGARSVPTSPRGIVTRKCRSATNIREEACGEQLPSQRLVSWDARADDSSDDFSNGPAQRLHRVHRDIYLTNTIDQSRQAN